MLGRAASSVALPGRGVVTELCDVPHSAEELDTGVTAGTGG
jgi:hypothetical protein